MTYRLPSCVVAIIAVTAAGLLAVPAAAPPLPRVQLRDLRLVDNAVNVADIMAGSGTPIPSDAYVQHVFDVFVEPFDNYANYVPEPVDYPAGNYALYTGVKSLPLDTSEAQGTKILDNMITAQVADGSDVVMKGQSQSSTVAGMTMTELAAQGVSSKDVSFVLTGDPDLPNGGLFERADGFTSPSLGITFSGPTPSDLYPTTIYTLEYDGFADVCQYPIDAICDLNSILGIQFVHPTYSTDVTTEQLKTAIPLPTVGETMTHYYMMPTADLPLLDPLRLIPVIGNPLADLLQPDLKVLVNLGYGDPDYGWSQGPANVPTEFGLFPSFNELAKVPALLVSGAETGIEHFIGDFTGTGPNPVSLSSLTSLLDPASGADPSTALSTLASDPASLITEFVNVVNTLSGALSTAYATLLPTADVVNALVTSLPAYDLNLFTEGLHAGDLLAAIGQPIASDTYLLQMAAGFEIFAVIDQVETIVGDLSSL